MELLSEKSCGKEEAERQEGYGNERAGNRGY
jgi:hypothetical protein